MAKQEKTGVQKALQRIEKAKTSRLQSLNLSWLGLTVIPDSILALTKLTSLNVQGNDITTVPKATASLSEIMWLDLSLNQLATIPDSITALTKLKNLVFRNNKVTTIPDSIARLSEMVLLDLSHNQIATIPDSIAALKSLKNLVLQHNKIATIPESVSRFSDMRKLDLSDNLITTIPDAISRLAKIEVILLQGNRITMIPESMARLSEMRRLHLSGNRITTIPDSISQLTKLAGLGLRSNKITAIPESISRLSEMRRLDISDNKITAIPDSISQLAKLESILLQKNQITTIPESISRLAKLRRLDLSDNKIASIPASISQLTNLEVLNLANNQLLDLPSSLARLKKLETLDLSGNQLSDELMAAAARGAQAFLRYLESIETRAAHPRTVKLVLLGEPLVGKTTLLEALKGNIHPCDPNRKETLGVNVANVDKKNPDDGQPMHLAVWDFSGQHMEHATHQPFLTENAIFIILWNARMGTGAGKRDLWYWLELLKMRVRDPKFLLVATHAESTPADLNLTEIQRVYKGCQGNFAVELCSLTGFEALEGRILELAATSQALKAVWPRGWLPVRDQIRKISTGQPHMSSAEFKHLMEDEGVRDTQQQKDLAEQLHQLGEILYFQELDGLSGLVVLNPAWLSSLIARVVRSAKARENRGILQRQDLDELWRSANLSAEVREHLVRLMDHFDLTYSTLDADDARIVVEALPYSTPEELERIKLPADQPEMEMIFRFPTLNRHLPPGIPTWGIARAHRLARPGLGPWRDAAFFEDEDTGSRAQILASDSAKEVRLKVTADYPPFFMGRMEAILRDTFRRYRELVPERRLPCRCRPSCTHSFAYEVVVGRRNSRKLDITCDASGADVLLDTLLMGYAAKSPAGHRAEEADRRRSYTTLLRAMNEQMEKTCPSVFTLMPSSGFKQLPTYWDSFTGAEELDLCLYCEHDAGWHTTPNSVYRFIPNKAWVERLKAHWSPLIAVSLHVAPLAKAVGWAADLVMFHAFGEAIEGLHSANHTAALSPLADELGRQEAPQPVDLETRAVLKELIEHLDSQRPQVPHYAGLHRHIVEDGRLLWLCPHHLEIYKTK